MRTKIFVHLLLLSTICYLLPTKNIVFGQHFESPSYIIDWGNFNITSGRKTSTNYRLTDTVGQNAPGRFTNSGYMVKSGFQYIYDTFYKLSFSIDDLSIDFGSIVPSIGSTQSNIITISSPAGHGYQIMTSENHPLQIDSASQIPDTTCDSGTCSESTSGVWINSSTYGFGFNAIGINSSGVTTDVGTSNYFTDNTYYRQFANTAASEIPQIIMSEDLPVRDHRARVTYKVNISPLQASGNYQNSLTFIAVPKY